jgi:hypothetical protein
MPTSALLRFVGCHAVAGVRPLLESEPVAKLKK